MRERGQTTVADIRSLKGTRKITVLFVETEDEAAAAAAAGIDMLSIDRRFLTRDMREAAGKCFVQSGLPYGELCTSEDYLRAAHDVIRAGADCVYCAASTQIVGVLAAEGIPVVGHVGLVPSKATWTGGYKAVGKTADSALVVWRNVKALEIAGAIAAELEVVPDRVAAEIAKRTSLIMIGMGAGPNTDAEYLFAEDVLGFNRGHVPRHAKAYRDFASEYARLQQERIAAFGEFKADVESGTFPSREHTVQISDTEFESFVCAIDT